MACNLFTPCMTLFEHIHSCQQNIGTGSGYDAGDGTYQRYLAGDRTSGFCAPVNNQTLPPHVQNAVCNEEIKIFDTLFTLFWDDGTWFYEYTTQATSEYIASQDNNTFTRCPSTTLNKSPSSSGLQVSGGGMATGVVIGAIAAILFCGFSGGKREWSKGTYEPTRLNLLPWTRKLVNQGPLRGTETEGVFQTEHWTAVYRPPMANRSIDWRISRLRSHVLSIIIWTA
ncbi:hypothetical protein BDP27DRAFT_1364710 [Rhodocollybia butyracea]|uniref:Uncharacterized protein n=1 Tax=Rhodocollybia butyracea TaxID=206335 RepID=A0A9P5PSD8_9AGAR|nr:hypothetical protein BDP27DRAFT_1364710 [Rhodocollybia butyracea]